MAAIQINWKPTNRQLRQFGAIGFAALPVLGWLLSGRPAPSTWATQPESVMIGLSGAGILSGILAWLRPSALKVVFLGATILTFPIGMVLSELILLAIYAIAFVPMAILFRLIGRDALDRRIDRQATSYWTPKEQPKDATSYFRQS